MPRICLTRALKNARYIQSVARHIIPVDQPAEGFASLVPLHVLERFHLMSEAELKPHPHLLQVAKTAKAATPSAAVILFSMARCFSFKWLSI